MKKITMTLSSAEVALTDGRGSVTASVNNASSAPERVVLGAFPTGNGAASAPVATPPPGPAADSSPSGADAAAGGPSDTMPTATVERALRTIPPGATEQYEVAFDTTNLSPGAYTVKLIPYSADEAPEDYAVLGHVVTLTVTQAKKAEKKKGFPWWIVILAAVVIIGGAIAAVVFLRPTPEPVPSATASPSPSDVIVLELTGFSPSSATLGGNIPVTLSGRFVEPTTVSVGPFTVMATRVSDTEYEFTLPPGTEAGQVQLLVASGGKQVGVAIFEYTAPPLPDPVPRCNPRIDLCFIVDPFPSHGVPGFSPLDGGPIDPGDILRPDVQVEVPSIIGR